MTNENTPINKVSLVIHKQKFYDLRFYVKKSFAPGNGWGDGDKNLNFQTF